MDTIWVDINLGTKEYDSAAVVPVTLMGVNVLTDDGSGVVYVPEITERIELVTTSRDFVSKNHYFVVEKLSKEVAVQLVEVFSKIRGHMERMEGDK